MKKDIINSNDSINIKDKYEERIKELAILNEIGHALNSSIVIKDLIKLIYEQTTRIVPVSAFYIAIHDKEKNELNFIFDILDNERQRDEEVRRKFGNGRTEYIIKTKKPLYIESNPQKIYRQLGIISNDNNATACMGVPLIASGNTIGALVVQSYRKNHGYKPRHIDLLTTIASQAAIALQNASLFEQQKKQNNALQKAQKDTKERVRELSILNEIGHAINSSIVIKDLIGLIYRQTTRILRTSAFYIALCDKEKKELHFIFDVLEDKRQRDEEVKRKFGKGRTEYIINTRRPIFIKNNPQKTYKKLGIISNDKKAKACIGVPLITAGEVLGALVVQSYKENHGYEKRHISLLATIANQAAIALQNARLFEQQRNQNIALEKAQKDTDNILANVTEGVFLIDQKYKIASRYSVALEDIFESVHLSGKNLVTFMKSKISSASLSSLSEYMELLFDPSIDEVMIAELNPLEEEQCTFKLRANEFAKKYLSFMFKRVYHEDKIINIFITVKDLTSQIELESALKESRAESKKQMEWLFAILNINSQLLIEFLSGAMEEMAIIKKTIAKTSLNKDDINTIYRSIHTIKGNAAMLQLQFLQEEAHSFEDFLGDLYENDLNEGHSKQLAEKYKKLNNIFVQIEILMERVNNFNKSFEGKTQKSDENQFVVLKQLLNKLSDKYNKKVKLNTDSYDPEITPLKYKLLIRDIIVQLTRNSIYHGIEAVDERKPQKEPYGTISVSNKKDDENFVLMFEDDGRGIQIDRLKQKAMDCGKWRDSEINSWDINKLAELIYQPGLSTADNSDLTAGRGIGMDVVKQKVEKYGGSIDIKFEERKFTRFSIVLPN